MRGLTCFNWTVRLSSSSLTHTMAGCRTLLGSRMSTCAGDKHPQLASGNKHVCFQLCSPTHAQRCVPLDRDARSPSTGPPIEAAGRQFVLPSQKTVNSQEKQHSNLRGFRLCEYKCEIWNLKNTQQEIQDDPEILDGRFPELKFKILRNKDKKGEMKREGAGREATHSTNY